MKRFVGALLLGMLAVLALVLFLNFRREDKIHDAPPLTPPAGENVAREPAVSEFSVSRQRERGL